MRRYTLWFVLSLVWILCSGRRNHFYILALGLLPIAHHSARLPVPVEIRPHVGAALEKMLAQ